MILKIIITALPALYAFFLMLYGRWNAAAVMMLIAGACAYYAFFCKNKEEQVRTKSEKGRGVLTFAAAVLFGAALSCVIGFFTVLRLKTFTAPDFDFGIFVNMFYNMKKSFGAYTTVERDGLLSHFAVHVSPIFYLILPVYALFPSPVTLQICQALIVGSSAVPLYLLALRTGAGKRRAALLCAVLALYPAASGGCFYDLHENCFLLPLLLWMFWAFEADRTALMYVFAAAVLTVKEDAPVYVAVFALWMLISGRKRKHGAALLGVSCAYFAAVCTYLSIAGEGIKASSRYAVYGKNAGEIIVNLLKDPALALEQIASPEKLPYLACMLLPLALLPFMTKKPSSLILLAPLLIFNLLPAYRYQYDIYFHYSFGSTAFLFYLSAMNLPRIKNRTFSSVLTLAAVVISAVMFRMTVIEDKGGLIELYRLEKSRNEFVEETLNAIPEEASVRASVFYLPFIAERSEIYALDTKHDTEYTVIDLRLEDEESETLCNELLSSDEYELIEYYESLIAVFLRKTP
ncbi:MAG: DUF2079 domain-containing protein [Firmicutes bacterium]|nr:DUF2079 domain-containing protein [Bacillota bacterium]